MTRKLLIAATALSVGAFTPAFSANLVVPFAPADLTAEAFTSNAVDHFVRVKDDKDKKDKKKKKKDKDHGSKADKKASKEAKKARKEAEKSVQKAQKEVEKHNKKAEKYAKKLRRSAEERVIVSERVMAVPAPTSRDMTTLLSALPLALLGQDVIFQDIEEDRLLTYRNCPPGLAKKDPPCVPPGLAKEGVTYEQWVSYDDRKLNDVYLERRDSYLASPEVNDVETVDIETLDDTGLLLTSQQVAALYDLSPAPAGQRYALIDGMPVLLEDRNYIALARINDMARVPVIGDGLQVAPTAALTQAELMQTYLLPPLDPGYSYSVLNGEVLALEDQAFETLQLLRIARAVF